MRCLLILLPVLGLGACKDEPSFDERYQETGQQIGQKAGEIDQELEKSAQADGAESKADCEGSATPCP